MISFEKNIVENIALQKLRKINPYKYKDAIVEGCEKPDIQNLKLSIGVEVTTCDFDAIYRWHKYYGKPLLEVFRMEAIDPIRFSDIEYLCRINDSKEFMDYLIDEKIYLERKGKLKQLKTYSDIEQLNLQDKLYLQSDLDWFINLNENLTVKNIYPPGFFTGQIVDKLRDTLKKKERKFENYKKFSENNIYIYVFSADNEEYIEFEESTDFSNCCFDHIYISDFWNKDNPIYIIDTKL